MDTDAMLQPINQARSQANALMDVVRANTEVFKEIKADLATCNNADRVHAITVKVEQAITDLSLESQKIPPWVKKPKDENLANEIPQFNYGQYPVANPLNPANPVLAPEDMPPPPPDDGGSKKGIHK